MENVSEETENEALVYVADGILFSEEQVVIIVGFMTDDIPAFAQSQTSIDAEDPWHTLRVKEKTLRSVYPVMEYILR